jgi:hypothetical protein
MLKSCLHLETEFQLRSFDSIVAHAAIVVARYIFLALENRESRDDRSIGELYMFVCDELADISFAQTLALLFSLLTSFLSDRLCRTESVVDSAIRLFLAALPDSFNRWKAFMVCES